MRRRQGVRFASVCFAILSLPMIYFGAVGALEARARPAWPTTQGLMYAASIVPAHAGRSSYRFYPKVAYGYSVAGRSYRGNTFSLDRSGDDDRGALERRLASFRPGATIPVRYDPADPARSVLEVGHTGWEDVGLMLIGIATLAAAVFFFRVASR